jgi:uncharacterized SAM-binding protein YcdF (DUF218 family)
MGPMRSAFSRILSAAIACFLAIESLRTLLQGRNEVEWLVDCRGLPPALFFAIGMISSASFAAYSAGSKSILSRRALWCACLLLGAGALRDSLRVVSLFQNDVVASRFPLPFSLLVLLAAITIAVWAGRPVQIARSRRTAIAGVVFATSIGFAFPILQMITFGLTDYRRTSDAILVFGAGVAPDGTPSSALKDRVATACELYHQGLSSRMVFSGGPGRGSVTEPEAMKTLAVAMGVPESAILLDECGFNTRSSIRNVTSLAGANRWSSVIAVSHFYHLPRIKLESQRRAITVFTVPAKQQHVLSRLPYYMIREAIAGWSYYARGLWPCTDRV